MDFFTWVRTQLVAAIGALFPVRAVDAGNSSVLPLGPAGTFVGPWTARGQKARIDIALTVAAATDLIVEHTDNVGAGAEAALTETWPATGAHPSFPTNLPRLWYRVRLTDTGGGGAVNLVTFSDPEPLDTNRALSVQLFAAVIPTGVVTWAVPIGARSYSQSGRDSGTPRVQGVQAAYSTGANGAAWVSQAPYGANIRLPLDPGNDALARNDSAGNMDFKAWFYP